MNASVASTTESRAVMAASMYDQPIEQCPVLKLSESQTDFILELDQLVGKRTHARPITSAEREIKISINLSYRQLRPNRSKIHGTMTIMAAMVYRK